MLYGKNVVLGVSGGIACYKACEVVSRLKKLGAGVDVIMTENATKFVAPLTFQTLAKSAVVLDAFEPVKHFDIGHISLAKKADILVVAPATANVIAKFANGVADDMLSTTYLACNAPKLICPAMNTAMYEDEATVNNMRVLAERGVQFEEPSCGPLACGDVGKGRLAEPEQIVDRIVRLLTPVQDLDGKRVLVTAGGTEEPVDSVRVITNRSSGKMGFAIAEECAERGASVVLVRGNTSVPSPRCLEKEIAVKTTAEMYDACLAEADECDIFIMAAAPADYRVDGRTHGKLKADTIDLHLVKNPDIAAALGQRKGDKKLVIFAAETNDAESYAIQKLEKKHADVVVANDVTATGAGFDVDTNIATIISANGKRVESGLVSKRELAKMIVNTVLA